ncbi:MAG: T9SS type A sorting domain-containing protein [Bacteroidales bacterium]|nr:T9SS type A sorting domain-containing protein [Bacteroidales bacterium]
MKLKTTFASVIFMICAVVSQAQISQRYYQGFEAGEAANYVAIPAAAATTTTTFYKSGSQGLKLAQSTTEDVVLVLDTIDLTDNASLTYITLQFDNICRVWSNGGGNHMMGTVSYRWVHETNWINATPQQYNATEAEESSYFTNYLAFFNMTYNSWFATPYNNYNNGMWRSERFDFNAIATPAVPVAQRKLLIRFVLRRKTTPVTADAPLGEWYFDNIKVTASNSAMTAPRISMVEYPDGINHPISRGTRIMLDASTTVQQGIDPDSAYIAYRVADRPGINKVPMTAVAGATNRYVGYIPFEGYDTAMYFYCNVCDATTNANRVTFPKADNSWIEYRSVRGKEVPIPVTSDLNGTYNINNLPFPAQGAHKSEWVLDSTLLTNAGYGPGAVTALTFTFNSSAAIVPKDRVQIRMANVPTDYTRDTNSTRYFYSSYMRTVYDGALNVPAANEGTPLTITLQDTFYYAGKDILFQFTSYGQGNTLAATVKALPTAAGKPTIYHTQSSAENYNPFTGGAGDYFNEAYNASNRRPSVKLNARANLPLLYDLGISELVDPSYTTAMVSRPGSITVKLKNYGAFAVNAVRISYSIDDSIPGYYDWSGNLAADAEQTVVIASNSISIPAGYHTLRVWVEDTVSVGSARYRDHEPLNDTAFSQFIVCDGPLSGVRYIGGSTPDYNDIDEFLFSLSRCGVSDSLVVKVAPGYYPPFTVPAYNGASAANYVVFEPISDSVFIYADNTTNSPSIVNLEQTAYIRFRNFNFVRNEGPLTDMVTMALTSIQCRFEGCTFEDRMVNPPAAYMIASMINSGFAYNLIVDKCTFIGGRIGVDLRGQAPDITSHDNSVTRSLFRNQNVSAISVQNQTNVVVDSNEMYDIMGNSSYALMISECDGQSRFTRNKIYTSHGAGGIGVSNVTGTSSNHILVANNMIVGEDNGQANLMRSPLNVIQAAWTDVVYNSVKMTAPTRNNTAAAILGGGALIDVRFVNNVMVTLDNMNYAFNYSPSTVSNVTIGHNVYYSRGTVLNRMSGTAYADLTAWTTAYPTDNASVEVNPNFLNGSQVDLRTYNRLVKGVGTPIAQVTEDMFGTARNATAPCPGAFEFVALFYDFEPEALISPELSTCYMPENAELVVRLRNSGVNAYNSTVGGLTLHYQVDNNAPQQVAINQTIPSDDTVTIHTGAMLQLPPNGMLDATYNLKMWLTFAPTSGDNDPNQTNDSNAFVIVSKYHPASPNDDVDSADYADIVTLAPTLGIDTWAVSDNAAAPHRQSQIYWYADSTSSTPIHKGSTFTTDTLRQDTAFYIRQRRELPIVRFTQFEIGHAAANVGVTPDLPSWVSSNRKIALQLTNIGDATAYLQGDTLMTLTPVSGNNNKIYVFGDVSIEPGQSLLVQMGSGNGTNLPLMVSTNNINFNINSANNANLAFVLKRNGSIEDVVALNTAPTATYPTNQTVTWSSMNIPSYIWSGAGVNIGYNVSAGIVRTAFNGNASDWRIATAGSPMFIASTDTSWIRYEDNSCDGGFGKISVVLRNPPMADLAVDVPVLPESGCGLGDEDITVTVHNYGISPVSSLVLNYCAGGDTVSETISSGIPANGTITHTFAQQLNMAFNTDSVVTVRVWVDSIGNDHTHLNDTNYASTTSLFTPVAPVTLGTRLVNYAERDTITVTTSSPFVTPIWYDYSMNPVDTGYTYVTDILFTGGTMGMSHIATHYVQGQIGFGNSLSSNTAYPSPFQTSSNYAKQQYIYSAHDLRKAGVREGNIATISFYLDSIFKTNNTTQTDSVLYNKYYISLGTTADTIFSSTSAWKPTTVVYERDSMVVYRTSAKGWVTHTLDSAFYWDGVSSLVVQVAAYVDPKFNKGIRSTYTTKTNTVLYKNADAALSPSLLDFVAMGNRGSNRPNIIINNTELGNAVYDGCVGPITPYTVQLVNLPSVDMALVWPGGIDTVSYSSCAPTPFHVTLRNQGSGGLSGVKVYYVFDTLPVDSVAVTNTLPASQESDFLLMTRQLHPGRHTLKAYVSVPGDNVHYNDTIYRSFVVSFCAGNYTIAQSGNPDFFTFSEAVDTLNIAGIDGPVTFMVSNGTYVEQLSLGALPGSSAANEVSFVGIGDSVLLTASTSQTANYVVNLNNTSNIVFSNLNIEARPVANNVNYANALVLKDGDNIRLVECNIKVKGTINNTNASCIVLNGNVTNFTMLSNVLDSGYYSIMSNGTVYGYSDFVLHGNTFKNFWSQGINLRGVENLSITSNEITSGVTNNNALTGIYLTQATGNIAVSKNAIYLVDEKNGGKMGIRLNDVSGSSLNPALVSNNMISCYGLGTSGLPSSGKPSGIWIEGASSYVNVLFNSVRVYCGPNTNAQFSDGSYSFYAANTTSNLQVMNNIFSNFSKGYAYYVKELNTVIISNYNAYYTVSTRPLAWKQTQLADLAALQTTNNDDANSVFTEPYFVSERDLHLQMTDLVALAQYTSDVPDDIDGSIRPQIPGPTIGAHEKDITTHDMAVVRIHEPVMPANINNPTHVESDSVMVVASFYNNGRSAENDVQWYAYIEVNDTLTLVSDTISLGTFQPAEMRTDTLMMAIPLGVTREQIIHVAVICDGDMAPQDNDLTSNFYLAPAFNLAATKMATDRNGCELRDAKVSITIKNDGAKTLPLGTVLNICYVTSVASPANVSISTLGDTIREMAVLDADLLPTRTTTLDFTTRANLYPTDTAVDISVRIVGWCKYQYDISPENDTTKNNQNATVNSYYTPAPPVGFDTSFAYGTWGEVRAMQENKRPIRWYRDSTVSAYYQQSQYAASTMWRNTPQYFDDSTYYLNCLSAKNCPSHFSEVHVTVRPRVPRDMAMEKVLAPLGGRVYMENDTVRVRIANYGTTPQNNIPITYCLKQGNTQLQLVTEVCAATVAPLATHTYTFNTLLDLPTPTQAKNYTLSVWTELASDTIRRNDTLRTEYKFSSLAESKYSPQKSSSPQFDVTRVSFNEIDLDLPPMGRGLTDMASYAAPDYPVLHVSRGMKDSLFVQLTKLDVTDLPERCRIWAMIDFNRNGTFEGNELVVNGDVFYDNEISASEITISNDASYGYMRMRIAVGTNDEFPPSGGNPPTGGIPSDKNGHTLDFLLFVDKEPVATDLAITQIAAPRSYLVRDGAPKVISFRIANKGQSAISNPEINYLFEGDTIDPTAAGSVTYPGTLQPGTSAILSLPDHVFPLGTSTLTLWHTLADDANGANDTLVYEYHRFHVVTLTMEENFDDANLWYAPSARGDFSHNYWERGVPAGTKFTAAHSAPNAWVTDLDAVVRSGKKGNVSYLYSPIINMSQIRPDTLSFYARRDLLNKSSVHLEFLNFENKWQKAVDTSSRTVWYNNTDDEVFSGTSAGNNYVHHWVPTSQFSGDFTEMLQFRFVFTAPIVTNANTSFGEGFVLDDFTLTRARLQEDAGVVDIIHPVDPQYGQTVYPTVVVKNFGTDTIRAIRLGYTYYGSNLSTQSSFTCLIAPDEVDTFQFTTPFVITHDFPSEFSINAFPYLAGDLYYENDTCSKSFSLRPLDHDISAEEFVYPLARVVAGDTAVKVTMRIRNFGAAPINTATATYIVNGQQRVDEDINFIEKLGRALQPSELYDYTFTQKIWAPMGTMRLTGIIKSDQNDYVYNDTIYKVVDGISNVIDLAATAVIVDTSDWHNVRVQLVIDNMGSRGANNFEVGFYIDDNPATARVERYTASSPLSALTTGYHLFNVTLPNRAAGYRNVTAFVHIDGDNDPRNDTTKVLLKQVTDIEAVKVVIEENANPDCKVHLQVRNNGNMALVGSTLQMRATINGTTLTGTCTDVIMPGMVFNLPLDGTLEKSPTQTYTGTGSLVCGNDANPNNNETSVIEVQSRVVDIDEVDQLAFEVGQNYPNPFTNQTTIPFTLPTDARVRIFVVDAMGQVLTSFERQCVAGEQEVTLDMSRYSTGVYYYGIEVNGERRMRKMIMR